MAFCVCSYNELLLCGVWSLTFVIIPDHPNIAICYLEKTPYKFLFSLLKAIFLKSHQLSVAFTHHANGFYKYSDRSFFSKLSSKERIRNVSSEAVKRTTSLLPISGERGEKAIEGPTH